MNIEEIEAEIKKREASGAQYGLNHKGIFSDKEMELFKYFEVEDLTRSQHPSPHALYNAAMKKAFINNMQGSAVDSLRTIIDGFEKNIVRRKTEEFDNLIRLD